MDEKIIGLGDIMPGDVISAEATSLVGELIAGLTKSNVSHSAIVYYDKDGKKQLVQVGLNNITVDPVESLLCKDDLYISRFRKKYENENFDMTPVLNVADDYLAGQHKYGWSEIALFIPYYLSTQVTIGKAMQKALVKNSWCFEFAFTAFIATYALWHDEKKEVCSQFVYNCFMKAGEEYHIDYKKDYSDNSLISRMRREKGIEEIIIQLDKNSNLKSNSLEMKKEDEEKALRQLSEIMSSVNGKVEFKEGLKEVFVKEFLEVMGRNCLRFCQAIVPGWENVRSASLDKVLDAFLGYARKYPTPEDLKNNFPDLIMVGKLEALNK